MTLGDPNPNPQTTQIPTFYIAFHVLVVDDSIDFKFGVQVNLGSLILQITSCPWKGRGHFTWLFKICSPCKISLEWLSMSSKDIALLHVQSLC